MKYWVQKAKSELNDQIVNFLIEKMKDELCLANLRYFAELLNELALIFSMEDEYLKEVLDLMKNAEGNLLEIIKKYRESKQRKFSIEKDRNRIEIIDLTNVSRIYPEAVIKLSNVVNVEKAFELARYFLVREKHKNQYTIDNLKIIVVLRPETVYVIDNHQDNEKLSIVASIKNLSEIEKITKEVLN